MNDWLNNLTFEQFANMPFAKWVGLMGISVSGVAVRHIIERPRLTITKFVGECIATGFLSYITALHFMSLDAHIAEQSAIVSIISYQAVNILRGISKIGMAFADDPIKMINKARGKK